MKKVIIITGSILAALLVIALVVGFIFWFAFGGGILFLPNPPKPEITYGEFPFTLTYELNGEIKVIEDTVICEYDGVEIHGGSGKIRKWKSHLKSGNERLTLLDLRPLEEKNEFDQTMLELFFSYGNGEYYMGDEWHRSKPEIRNYIEYRYQTADGKTGGSSYSADVAYEKYKIRLISWEAAEPIENTFK